MGCSNIRQSLAILSNEKNYQLMTALQKKQFDELKNELRKLGYDYPNSNEFCILSEETNKVNELSKSLTKLLIEALKNQK